MLKLQKLELNPLVHAPTNYDDKMKNIHVLNKLQPADPYKKNLPPQYKTDLDMQYQTFLSQAVS